MTDYVPNELPLDMPYQDSNIQPVQVEHIVIKYKVTIEEIRIATYYEVDVDIEKYDIEDRDVIEQEIMNPILTMEEGREKELYLKKTTTEITSRFDAKEFDVYEPYDAFILNDVEEFLEELNEFGEYWPQWNAWLIESDE